MGIRTTGNGRVDGATAEIAGHIRDGRVGSHGGWREQDHYDEAMRLRDEILHGRPVKGTPEYDLWVAAINVAVYPSLKHQDHVWNAQVAWNLVEKLRAALDAVGIDWKGVKTRGSRME